MLIAVGINIHKKSYVQVAVVELIFDPTHNLTELHFTQKSYPYQDRDGALFNSTF